MKTIVHLLNSSSFSGAENVALNIIKNTQSDEFRNIYIAIKGPIEEILIEKGVEYYLINNMNVKSLKKINSIFKPNIIHAHDYTMSILATVCFKKSKIISHIHNNSPWIKKYCIYSFVFLIFTMRVEKILTVSKSIEEEYVFSRFIHKKIKCIGNPLDNEEIIEKSNEYKYECKHDLIFLGRITAQKNPDMILKIIKSLKLNNPNIDIAIVGNGDQMEQFKNQLIEYNYRNITILDFQKNPYPILKKSKLLCMPSLWEGFGLVAYEALSLGVPVICSGVGGLKNIVDNRCGLLCDQNLEKYVNEISKLLMDKAYYAEKVTAALEKSKELRNIASYTNVIVNLYSSL